MRLDLTANGAVLVRLSRRNVLSLLSKLEQPGSARMLVQRGVFVDGVLQEGLILVVGVEPDDVHYADREPPGAMSPETEAFIAAQTPANRPPRAVNPDHNGDDHA